MASPTKRRFIFCSDVGVSAPVRKEKRLKRVMRRDVCNILFSFI
jgi:hypothetical protein